eukprot:757652-Hanusia_phi.AAC.2
MRAGWVVEGGRSRDEWRTPQGWGVLGSGVGDLGEPHLGGVKAPECSFKSRTGGSVVKHQEYRVGWSSTAQVNVKGGSAVSSCIEVQKGGGTRLIIEHLFHGVGRWTGQLRVVDS